MLILGIIILIHMLYLYNLIIIILFIPALFVLVIVNRKRISRESFRAWQERIGVWNFKKFNALTRPLLWFHCASLGEVKAIEPIIRKLKDYDTMVTVMTQTGHKYVEQNKISNLVFFAPVDLFWITNKIMRKVKPKGLVIVETELWPNLINSAKKNNVKVLSINGRLSEYKYGYYKASRPFWSWVLNKIDLVAARSNEDSLRFRSLGCDSKKVVVTGNIKYDDLFNDSELSKEKLGYKGEDTIIVGGSTRKEEENILIDLFTELKTGNGSLKLVLAPRHQDRNEWIEKKLSDNSITYSLLSSGLDAKKDCILIDTFGELKMFYSVCDIAYIGGSMVDKGGQNPIEAAAFKKPIIFGQYMKNFNQEAALLKKSGGAKEVKTKSELKENIEKLIKDKGLRKNLGKSAFESTINQKGAVNKTVDLIRNYCSK